VEVVASLSQGRTAAAQCGLFTHKSVPVIFEPPFPFTVTSEAMQKWWLAENTTTAECTDILMHKMFVMHRSR